MASVSLNSILSQSFGDFELLVVDDGGSEETRDIVHSFKDPRITHIRQANDGPSSARNRALNVAKGEYICFLDADDVRPAWAFEAMMEKTASKPDCVFSPGVLSELRNEALPFYDTTTFDKLRSQNLGQVKSDERHFIEALRLLFCLEPQSANKCIRRDFAKQYNLRFPSGLSFFEDSNFHTGVLMNLSSYTTTELPTFTYFRRYGPPRLTGSQGTSRFDVFGSVANVLHLFAQSGYFQDAILRQIVLASCFRVLQWGEESISLDLKYSYQQSLKTLIKLMNPRYLQPLPDTLRQEACAYASWVEPTLGYVELAARQR